MVLSDIPSRHLLLGSIMCSYHDEMLRANTAEGYEPLGVDEVIASGFKRAFRKHVDILSQKKEDAQRFLD